MIRQLPPDLADIAKNELKESPSQIANDLFLLKEWIATQPHLRARTDDQWLVSILRGCKFNLERVKTKLDLYYKLRTTAADVTLRMNPTERSFIEFFKRGTCLILPKSKTKLYPRIILMRAGKCNTETHHVADIMCIFYYLVQILVNEDDVASVMGIKILVDFTGVTFSHLTQVTPSYLKKFVALGQDALPLRLKGSHHINVATGIHIIFRIISGFLNEKTKQRLFIHRSHHEIHNEMPEDCLPEEYGGTAGTVNQIIDYWVAKFHDYREWMERELTFGTNEALRPKKTLITKHKEVKRPFRTIDID